MPTNNSNSKTLSPVSSSRNRGCGGGNGKKAGDMPEKSASFHGRLPVEHRPMRRPKTQPDLLAGRRAVGEGGLSPTVAARVPAKVLVNVTVQRSLGAVQVVASTDWTVGELVGAALRQYIKEGRRPPLPAEAEPSSYGLHYSQFSLESLDPEEKLIGLGSRNFFLCPKAQKAVDTSTPSSPPSGANTCSNQAGKSGPKIAVLSWLKFF